MEQPVVPEFRAYAAFKAYCQIFKNNNFAAMLTGLPSNLRTFIDNNKDNFDAYGKMNSIPNTVLGNILGRMGKGKPTLCSARIINNTRNI